MNDTYILDDNGNPIPADTLTWGRWYETAGEKRRIGSDRVNGAHVSTVFLGLDHSFGGDTPILYETMIFGGKHDQYCEHYATREEAIEGHKKAIALVAEATLER